MRSILLFPREMCAYGAFLFCFSFVVVTVWGGGYVGSFLCSDGVEDCVF